MATGAIKSEMADRAVTALMQMRAEWGRPMRKRMAGHIGNNFLDVTESRW